MRPAFRLLASVKSSARFLEPGAPTGLTGLRTHATPRTALVSVYTSTLDKLKALPESSTYRHSTEALTKHRLKIVETERGEGYDSWWYRTKDLRNHVASLKDELKDVEKDLEGKVLGDATIRASTQEERDMLKEKYDRKLAILAELPKTEAQLDADPEPPLTAEQVSRIESQIGAGLIEEILQVAEGESTLVEKMAEAKIWEELVEKPAEGQWEYYERQGAHTATQKP
ncbi:NADH-ubiquinone oxidoreductase 29.9 kDa subunit [Lineolata rhizophorae]|uniref:NADH-ubiquinone oxidoreductase 29.9 kDa subunit n=1 Tax=Lineolata rhizophorae TaxID=578093 RepID=A0A6A6NTM9_9PEZI|nr:NADH-ubiquinone oxidoreductase 29.9 kDa subunit [Lineolata rhizophorae]